MARSDWVAEIMVRLDPDDFGALENVHRQFPHVSRTEVFRRVLRAAVCPADMLLRYRAPPGHPAHCVIPDWVMWGPFSPVDIIWRIESLQRKGWEIEAVQVAPAKPRPAWPGEAVEPSECAECFGTGGEHADDCSSR